MSDRSAARLAGALFLVTHVTSVGAVVLYGGAALAPALPAGSRPAVLAGAFLEVVLAVAVTGTAVALYPLVRRVGEGAAAGYVALRALESAVILVGVVAVAAVVGRPGSAAPAAVDPGVADGLLLVHDWTFLVGPGLVCPVNTVVLALVLLRTGLVPRWIPVLGTVGAVLVGVANLAVAAGLTDPLPVAAVPLFAWEVALAVTLLTRGLRLPGPVPPVPPVSPVRSSVPSGT